MMIITFTLAHQLVMSWKWTQGTSWWLIMGLRRSFRWWVEALSLASFSLSSSLLVAEIRATSRRTIRKLVHKFTSFTEDEWNGSQCGCVWRSDVQVKGALWAAETNRMGAQLRRGKDQSKGKLKREKLRGEKNSLCPVCVLPVCNQRVLGS